MKSVVAILLLATAGVALAETGKPADRPITVYKAGTPYIYDSQRVMLCPSQGAANCSTPSKPEAQKKPAPKGVG
jgi:hypothetical protein